MTTRTKRSKKSAITKKILGEPMTPEVHLVRTLWFRSAIVGPIAIALITAWLFTVDTSLQWSLTPRGMNNFLNLFKLPIGIASLSLPLAAVVAANHRSMQTAKQILEQNSQNIFGNHLQHRGYFFKFIEDFKPFKNIQVSTPKLYENLFPTAVSGNLEPNRIALYNFINEIIATNMGINKELNGVYHNNEILIHSDEIKSLIGDYYVHRAIFAGTDYSFEEVEENSVYHLTTEIVSEFVTILDALIMCANFHRNYFDKMDHPALDDFESDLLNSTTILDSLKKRQFLYQELRAAYDEYQGRINNKIIDQETASENLKEQIDSITTNLRIEKGSDDLRFIIFNYFNNEERKIIRDHAPDSLRRDL